MGISEILARINWVDVLILILLFRICYVGFNRGLSNEITPLIGIFITLIIALHYCFKIGDFITLHTPLSSSYSYLISFIGLAIIIKFIFRMIELFIVAKIITVNIVSIYDKVGGLIAGVIRAILLISVILIALEFTPIDYIYYSVKERSLMGRKFLNIGHQIYKKSAGFLRLTQYHT